MAIKRAKTITPEQFAELRQHVLYSDHPLRDDAALCLSYYAGLRAHEIANLRWKNNILTVGGKVCDVLHITSDVGKRSKEREIPMAEELQEALRRLRETRPKDDYVFYAIHNYMRARVDGRLQPTGKVTPSAVAQWFRRLYATVGFEGCSSHSGRRTFITTRVRLAPLHGCSIVDVQRMAGHTSLETTAGYVDPSEHQHKLVAAWG